MADMERSFELFKGQFTGLTDMNGTAIREGDFVQFYHKGEMVICQVVYAPEWAMFCLQWPDGYKNKYPMNPEKYVVVTAKGQQI
jgi:hypothetical protein